MPWGDLKKGRHSQPNQDYFITFTTDSRVPHFRDFHCAALLAREIQHSPDFLMLAWVIMPDHVHFLATLQKSTLGNAVKNIKGRSARGINKLGFNFRWSPAYYDHALRAEESRISIARYIVANPLRANIVTNIGEYPFWNSVYLQ